VFASFILISLRSEAVELLEAFKRRFQQRKEHLT
jgi:hypothetical protein